MKTKVVIYLKSLLAGISIFILAVILSVVYTQIYLYYWVEPASMGGSLKAIDNNGGPGFELRGTWVDVPVLPVGLIAFAGGFYWTFRKTSKRHSNESSQS